MGVVALCLALVPAAMAAEIAYGGNWECEADAEADSRRSLRLHRRCVTAIA